MMSLVYPLAQQYDIDANLVRAIIAVESNFDAQAVSTAGAQGLMQLMPETATRYQVQQPFDPRANVEGGIRYLKDLWQRFGGNLPRVLAAYNAGEGAVARFGGIPPYPETRRYVARVLALYGVNTTSAKIYRYRTAQGSILFTDIPR
jgi:soluble lytic murein transglycosylase-like protein